MSDQTPELTEEQKFWLAIAAGVPIKYDDCPSADGAVTMTTAYPCDVVFRDGRFMVAYRPETPR